ncbi:MAG: hypothetical protein ABIE70_03605 [bacterium]
MDNKLLAQIRILDSDQILPYEWPQTSDTALDVDLSVLSAIRHPFLVTPLDDSYYLLLSETGYFRAFCEAGLTHFPVQVSAPEAITVTSDRIGLDRFGYDDLARTASRQPDQLVLREGVPQGPPPLGFVAMEFKFSDGRRVQAYLRNSSKTGCPQTMENLFRAVIQNGRYLSIVDKIRSSDSVARMAAIAATVTLPPFRLEDLKAAARAERHYPPGIIRAVTNRRMLDIDYPLSVLTASIPAAEKEAFFQDLMVLRQQSRRTAHYQGEVYLLNQQMYF